MWQHNFASPLTSMQDQRRRSVWQKLHIDWPLLLALMIVIGVSLLSLYSSSDSNLWLKQVVHLCLALCLMFLCAQIPIHYYKLVTPWVFVATLLLLITVLVIGYTGHGARRWINLGFMRFQPAETMKLMVPMMLCWYLSDRALPPRGKVLLIAGVIIMVPFLLVAKQPDLGTALLIIASGAFVLLLAGISWKFVGSVLGLAALSAPVLWYLMHGYQRQRVLTFLNPESDPLGSGYHIIQSKIAIGSGGWFGKGWGNGTQSNLDFLPERSTDFVFAVFSEEFGLLGILCLLLVYLFIIFRGLTIGAQAQDTFSRLLAGSISLTFFVYLFVNIGMVTGLLPVVGLPMPLFSYGGSSMVTLLAGFGILMSIRTHRKLLTS